MLVPKANTLGYNVFRAEAETLLAKWPPEETVAPEKVYPMGATSFKATTFGLATVHLRGEN